MPTLFFDGHAVGSAQHVFWKMEGKKIGVRMSEEAEAAIMAGDSRTLCGWAAKKIGASIDSVETLLNWFST